MSVLELVVVRTYVFDDFRAGGGFELELDNVGDGHFGSVCRLKMLCYGIKSGK